MFVRDISDHYLKITFSKSIYKNYKANQSEPPSIFRSSSASNLSTFHYHALVSLFFPTAVSSRLSCNISLETLSCIVDLSESFLILVKTFVCPATTLFYSTCDVSFLLSYRKQKPRKSLTSICNFVIANFQQFLLLSIEIWLVILRLWRWDQLMFPLK